MSSQKVDELIKKFRPQFGNEEHIALANQIGGLRKLRETVAKHEKRVQSLQNAVRKQTQNEKRLERMESSMIVALEAQISKQ